jgi:phospholipase/carboxylesterase
MSEDEAYQLALPLEWLPEEGAPQQLILLLHGWRESGAAMLPLAQALRQRFAQAAILAPDGPLQADGPARPGVDSGRMWYAVQGLSHETWPARVQATLKPLAAWVKAQQQRLGVGPAATALAGFSQGAVIALHAALVEDGLAGRVLAFAGCFTAPPEAAPRHTTFHFFHGSADEVIPAAGSRNAIGRLAELQGDATIDIAEGVGHTLHPALIDCALHRLTSHIPLRTWQAALGGGAGAAAHPE